MRTRIAVIVAGLGLLLSAAGPALAHHAFAAEYDAKKPIKLTGAVTKLEWLNPHTWFYIDVKDDTGKVTNWGFEMGSPNILLRAGWTRNSMKPGDVVTVEGSRAKDGSNNGNVKVVTLVSTGQRLFAGSSQEQQ
jgi:DNA/RNA endonuclease YhcR with UshA esterase domain